MRLQCQPQQFVPELKRRGVRLTLPEGRLVRRLASLVVKTNLVRPFWTGPATAYGLRVPVNSAFGFMRPAQQVG